MLYEVITIDLEIVNVSKRLKEKKKDVKHDIFGRAVREATSIERELQTLRNNFV